MKSSGRPSTVRPGRARSLQPPAGAGIVRDGLHDQRGHGERGDGVAEADPVALEEIGGDEGRGQAAQAEEEIDEVERGGAMRLADAADQRVGAGDHDAAADAEQEEQKHDAAVAARRGAAETARWRCNTRPRMRPTLSPWVSSSGPTPSEAIIRPSAWAKAMVAILRGREVEALREVGQDGAEHGGDHSVDEDGEDGGEDQHRAMVLSTP